MKNKRSLPLTWYVEVVSFHTGGRKHSQNDCQSLQGTEMLSGLWLLFFGVVMPKGPKRHISQLRAHTSLWKHHCFLKLSQTEAFKAFSRTADLPALGLLPKRFLRDGGCEGGYHISRSS